MSALGEPFAEAFFGPHPPSPQLGNEEVSMNDFMLLQLARARAGQPRREPSAERLRRAGYADGERRPRITRHWANR
jgi:hypothetical protein